MNREAERRFSLSNAEPLAQRRWFVVVTVAAAAAITVGVQVAKLGSGSSVGIDFVEHVEVKAHLAVIDGHAPDPWQYRVLSEYVVSVVRSLTDLVGVPHANAVAFIFVRFIQNVAVFGLSVWYWRLVGTRDIARLVGITFLVWSVSWSFFDSGLAVNTYSDIIFFLLAALLILSERPWFAVALTPIAVLNRETALMIPVLLVALAPCWRERRVWRQIAVALVLGAAAYLAVRVGYGERRLFVAYGHEMGIDLFVYNLRIVTFHQLVLLVGLLPLLAVAGWRSADARLRRLCVLMVPAWVAIHLVASRLAETRLLLVPLVLVLIPLAVADLAAKGPDDKDTGRALTTSG